VAKQRVALRVSKGGHNIPEAVIERRFMLGIRNLFEFIQIVDRWRVYRNEISPPEKIAEGERDRMNNILNLDVWKKLRNI
jgi:predicted ABC-type ATPase